jgi:serine/threonine protein kinase
MAPEVVNRSYGPEADVWAAGVTCYLLLSGRLPYADDDLSNFDPESIFRKITSDPLDLTSGDWQLVSEGAKEFVRSLLDKVTAHSTAHLSHN